MSEFLDQVRERIVLVETRIDSLLDAHPVPGSPEEVELLQLLDEADALNEIAFPIEA